MPESERTFEQILTELEDRVRKLESGDQPLEDALRLFEEGIELTRACHERLDAAERRIVELTEGKDGEVKERGM
jgi:exodeoxyribonuclease VII small subunit